MVYMAREQRQMKWIGASRIHSKMLNEIDRE